MRTVRVGIDTGGTFTDAVGYDSATGRLVTTKTPSTPHDPSTAFLVAVEKVLGLLGVGVDALESVSHGTTVATNALLEGQVTGLGFITTEGYEFLLEIARQSVPDGYGNSYFWVKPDRIVPPHLVRTVGGRLDHTGAELRPFDERTAVVAARSLRDAGVTSIGVCFLHSYADPTHERLMRDVLRREHPEAAVSISSDVLREYREYERAMTTLVDAAVKPKVARYVASIAQRLPSGVPFHIMKSNGGVATAEQITRQPVTTVLSGPAAGALGAATVARRAGFERILTLDGGGTSTDVAVVLAGEPTLTTEGSVGAYPSKIPMIEVVTVGSGGGSIAAVTPEGGLRVGPRSAGADPGPLCYGRGGADVTVTDAHLVLGRVPPHLLGGEIALDIDAARRGLAQLAREVGLEPAACAVGLLEVSAWNQANALRQLTVQRGLDVRDFTLTTFGGSGSLLLCRLMDILGVVRALVPTEPGTISAFGLLTVDVKTDAVRTAVRRQADLDGAWVERLCTELRAEAAAVLRAEGFADSEQRFEYTADLRYFGQAFEVRVPIDGPPDEVARAFHAAHRALYGYDFAADARQPVEWVNLRVTGIGPIARPEAGPGAAKDPVGPSRRAVCFEREYVDAAIHQRRDLGPGAVVSGPAVIEEFGSTVPIHPGYRATTDEFGNLVVTRG